MTSSMPLRWWDERPGKLRIGIWEDTYFSGSFREAVDLVLANPGLDPTQAIMQTRRGRTEYGYYLSLEQPLTDSIGMFARWSWNSGQQETPRLHRHQLRLSVGTSITGKGWGRPDDKLGLATAANALSPAERDYIALGGLGILIGDGRLNYSQEKILETFYTMQMMKGLVLTFDYQFMQNPGYNADRGPVSFFSARLHGEF